MIYDKVLLVTRPIPNDLTEDVIKEVIDFCDNNDLPWDTCSFPKGTNNVLIVAIGGDGTMLTAMRRSVDYPNSTVYGINTGTLGFLVEEYNNNITSTLSHIAQGHGVIEERMVLSGQIFMDGTLLKDEMIAVNEFVLSGMTNQAPVKVKVSINDNPVSENIGSGVLVASSTGSTAMALSAGGAIVSPSTNIMQIVPLMAHTLTSRPVITTGRDTISLKTTLPDRHQPIEIYGDGLALGTYYEGDGVEVELRITKHPVPVRVYRPETWAFFNVLREKMKW